MGINFLFIKFSNLVVPHTNITHIVSAMSQPGYDFELAITSSDALRLASCAQPAYGILLCSSQAIFSLFRGTGNFSSEGNEP